MAGRSSVRGPECVGSEHRLLAEARWCHGESPRGRKGGGWGQATGVQAGVVGSRCCIRQRQRQEDLPTDALRARERGGGGLRFRSELL